MCIYMLIRQILLTTKYRIGMFCVNIYFLIENFYQKKKKKLYISSDMKAKFGHVRMILDIKLPEYSDVRFEN